MGGLSIWMGGQLDGSVNEWVGEWVDGWVGRWVGWLFKTFFVSAIK